MKTRITTFTLVLLTYSLIAQTPPSWTKMWDFRYGGTGWDEFTCLQQTADGGYILGGSSNSPISGDKTQDAWDIGDGFYDFWIVKIDSLGTKQWDKRFGGIGQEELASLQQTSDGGYILGGSSTSGISGDKTQAVWDTVIMPGMCFSTSNHPFYDYWMVKIDSLGNKQWDKRFGGTGDETLYSLQQTSDGGYILGGMTWSGISGEITQANWDTAAWTCYRNPSYDFWIVKTDASGNKMWDKRFGGSWGEIFGALQQTDDGGYILGGTTSSPVSGDVSQPSSGSVWNDDFWIIKIDALGNKQWDKRLGGDTGDRLYALQKTSDKGYILGGYSFSGKTGDKTQDNFGAAFGSSATADYWMVKVDSLGNKQWDQTFGGTQNEGLGNNFYTISFGNILQTREGGYLMSGLSFSDADGNKSENNLGSQQAWLVKTDQFGNKEWDKTIFTSNRDLVEQVIQAKDGCFVNATMSRSGMGGYKTQDSWDSLTYYNGDYWVAKFCIAFDLNLLRSNVNCHGAANGTARVTAFGGLAPFNYLWSNGDTTADISNLSSGIYAVTVTDARGNSQADTIFISEPSPLTIFPVFQEDVTCFNNSDGSAAVFADGGTGDYSIIWSNGMSGETATGLPAGNYQIIVTDSYGCTNTTDIIIAQPSDLILATTSVTAHVTCFGASDGAAKANATGGIPPYSFLWSDGKTTSTPTDLPAGTYSVTVSDSNDCTATTSITIGEGPICTGVQDYLPGNISLYPNPTDGSVTLQMSSLQEMTSVHLKLYDALGRQLVEQNVEGLMIQQGITIDIKNQPENIFFLYITTEAGSRVMKVVKY